MNDNLCNGCGVFSLEDADSGRTWRINVSPGRVDSLEQDHEVSSDFSAGNIKFIVDCEKVRHVIGFYSAHRLADIQAPDYAKSIFFFVDELVFGNTTETPFIDLKKKFGVREFEAGFGGKVIKEFKYSWPWYREYWLDPMRSSKDVIDNLVNVSRDYRPEWLKPLS